ncbi:MAG TPA: DUF4373 domain-containing protein [Candidatus Marinimicrobia bacterium]|jgi:hypothetical protein|nr:DUF4373 domain-containing protein [Candidatus Neomarinimicrobiota bacterium]
MARPERRDVDYFPFYIKDGKTLFILESKYGCKGTGFFTNLMRFLCRTPNHYFQIKSESDRMYLYAALKCDEVSGAEMLNIMAETGKIDKKLWENYSIIASEDLINSLKPAYEKRKNAILNIAEIAKIAVSDAENTVTGAETQVSVGNNPQTKVKKSKLKETKVKETEIPEHLKQIWPAYLEMRQKKKKPATEYAKKLVIDQLEKWYPNDPERQIECLNVSIRNSWTDVYKLKENKVGSKYAGLGRDL